MFSQTFNIADYTPVLTDEQAGKTSNALAVADGENFAWKAGAVFSAYGHEARTSALPAPMLHPFIAKISDEVYYFCADGVYTWNGGWRQQFAYTQTYTHLQWNLNLYKWTKAFVGTRHWFCHPTVGLIYYDVHDDEWGTFRDSCWTGPTYAITQADLRLVVLLEDVVVWSKIDEGHIYDCDWHCGSGAQSLAKIHYGQPYTVMPYNNGWLTFTSTGVMISVPEMQQVIEPDGRNITVGPLVYRHGVATLEGLLIGPCAVTHIDERAVIWLTTKGFYQFASTQGGGFGAVQPWQPAMGAFYHDTLLSNAAGALEDQFCIEYACDQGWLFVSSRADVLHPFYNRAHVYQFDIDRWGSFNFGHLFVGYDRKEDSTLLEDVHFAFIDSSSVVQLVDHRPHADAWVKLTPQRLQLPNEIPMPATSMTAVQQIRLGTKKPAHQKPPPMGLRSSWLTEKREHVPQSNFYLMISGGFDSESQNDDEGEYATLLRRDENTAVYTCHNTGITHTLLIATDETTHFFQIDHIEITYILAGVL